jgi:hypothetical protein
MKSKKNLGKKDLKNKKCRVAQSCNVSDVTDSVEFANEPFNNNDRKKCVQNDKNENNRC